VLSKVEAERTFEPMRTTDVSWILVFSIEESTQELRTLQCIHAQRHTFDVVHAPVHAQLRKIVVGHAQLHIEYERSQHADEHAHRS